MAGLSRRFTLAVLLSFFLMAISGLARAAEIFVNTLEGEGELTGSPLCSLVDAVTAHNSQAAVNGCAKGTGVDQILFDVTGTITIDEPLEITNGTLAIVGPGFGCSSAGSCGVVISGGGSTQIIVADPGTTVFLEVLTLTNGFASTTTAGGGAVFGNGTDLEIFDSLLVNNQAAGISAVFGGLGGAIYAAAGSVEITNSTIANNTALHGSTFFSDDGAVFISVWGDHENHQCDHRRQYGRCRWRYRRLHVRPQEHDFGAQHGRILS